MTITKNKNTGIKKNKLRQTNDIKSISVSPVRICSVQNPGLNKYSSNLVIPNMMVAQFYAVSMLAVRLLLIGYDSLYEKQCYRVRFVHQPG